MEKEKNQKNEMMKIQLMEMDATIKDDAAKVCFLIFIIWQFFYITLK